MITQTAQLKKETPCPECGTSRVGHDYDDLYEIKPGHIERKKIMVETADYGRCAKAGVSALESLNRMRRWYGNPEMSQADISRYESSTGVNLLHEEEIDFFVPEAGCEKCEESSFFRY